jgi:arylsulfatase
MFDKQPESERPFSRRQLLGGALFSAAAAAQMAEGDNACKTPAFGGVRGQTAADSTPSPLKMEQAPKGSPNFIYIVLDDTGFSDLHCYGSEIATPHIDALAAEGLLYNTFRSKAICSPSRAALLTGRNSHAVGMKELAGPDLGYPNARGRVTPAAATVAQVLQSNGYSTYGVGKWHLVPGADMRASSPRTHWPLAKGFDRWYGFLSGWTDQYHPDLVEDNHSLPKPTDPHYHFSVDIVDKAIQMVSEHAADNSQKPFFLHVAFGATHTPLQIFKPYIDKYVSTFEKGWDQIREDRYRRQLEMGIIPAGTELPPRNSGDPAWKYLSQEERTVYTRFMAAYAGFLEHADQQIGRIVKCLKDANLFENTAIFLLSDNGGAPEGGVKGGFFQNYGDKTNVHGWYSHLEELGTDKTLPLYQRPWAMASDTPFRFYKLWPYRGGVQTPLIVSWPAGIHARGVRNQFVDIIDITPTVLEILGIEAPSSFEGVCQMPLQGKSIRTTFNDPNSPSPRDTQYFELWGARGIYHRGWEALAIHQPGQSFSDDHWQLFHTDSDFAQCVNLASQYPAKLEELKNLWWSEAARNGALPLLEAPLQRQHTYDQAL